MKQKTIILILIIAVCSVLVGYFIKPSAKINYVNTAEVFEKFNLKMELTKEYEKITLQKDEILNGMYMELEKINAAISSEEDKALIADYTSKRNVYLEKKKEFETQNSILLNKYDAQVYAQLNQYVQEYGKKHDLDAIIGANGQGNLMYGKESINITGEVITYINNRYNGKED